MIKVNSIKYNNCTLAVTIYTPSNRVPKYVKQELTKLKEEIVNNSLRLQHLTFNNGYKEISKQQTKRLEKTLKINYN